MLMIGVVVDGRGDWSTAERRRLIVNPLAGAPGKVDKSWKIDIFKDDIMDCEEVDIALFSSFPF